MDDPREPPTTRLELELVPGSAPIRGTIRSPGAADLPFEGWLELLAAIDRAISPGPPAAVADEASRPLADDR